MLQSDRAKLVIGLLMLTATLMVTCAAIAGISYSSEGVAFGEIASGETAERSIELHNTSERTIFVSKVKGCCGSEAALSAMSIAPNVTTILTVSLKPQLPGEFSKHVRIYSDDSESPVLVIPVTGTAIEAKGPNAAARWMLPAIILA